MKYAMLATLVLAGILPAMAEDAAKDGKKDTQPVTMFLSYDSNSDGDVVIEEYVAGRTADFKKLDENKDGKLSPEELKKHTALYPVQTPDPAISEEEWMLAFIPADKKPTEEQTQLAVKKLAANSKDTSFKKMDHNKDGKVSADEMGAFFVAVHRQNNPGDAAGVEKMVTENWFVMMDKNKDGAVTIEEYTGQSAKKEPTKKDSAEKSGAKDR